MAQIELRNIVKNYKKTTALDNINLKVRDKEFLVLFGPAGAGKTTLLKLVAGLEFPDEGYIHINDRIVNTVPPANRNISMVFENYALYPHFSVFDNIASPMRSKLYKKDPDYIRKAVNKVTSLMKIDHLLDRLPSQLSNGQRQRVALGRCLVREPNVFLMDEPLAHLDAKLRHFMRTELKEMQNDFDTTTIYVTHDYLEALSLGDRIAIVNEGKIVQIGTGNEVFYTPFNEFVAKLIGEPEINIIEGRLTKKGAVIELSCLGHDMSFPLPEDVHDILATLKQPTVHLGVRGSNLNFAFSNPAPDWIPGNVFTVEPIGNMSILTVDVKGSLLRIIAPSDLKCDMDDPIFIQIKMEDVLFFNADSGEFLIRSKQKKLLEVTQ